VPKREPAVNDLQRLAAAVRAHLAAKMDAESLIPEQETDWPDGYDFKELEKAEDVEQAAWEKLERLLVKAEKPLKTPKLPSVTMTTSFVSKHGVSPEEPLKLPKVPRAKKKVR
jgi:hypothetical protein